MNIPPIPVIFEPIFKPKPWGGRRLASLLNKSLPTGQPIGESWELADLAGHQSRVHGGPLAGRTLHELVELWGADLLGDARLLEGRLPLLVKFLDAARPLSVQVHPRTGPGAKQEAWYVIHADPGAKVFIGLKAGVEPGDLARAARGPEIVSLLRSWDARPGQCYYLPGGTPHALGAGVVVAEVQTPSEVTYRLYDWNRVGLDGHPRTLHVEAAVKCIADAAGDVLIPPPYEIAGPFGPATRLVECERFVMSLVHRPAGAVEDVSGGTMRLWIVLGGGGTLGAPGHDGRLETGDVWLIPAGCHGLQLRVESSLRWLEVTVPVESG